MRALRQSEVTHLERGRTETQTAPPPSPSTPGTAHSTLHVPGETGRVGSLSILQMGKLRNRGASQSRGAVLLTLVLCESLPGLPPSQPSPPRFSSFFQNLPPWSSPHRLLSLFWGLLQLPGSEQELRAGLRDSPSPTDPSGQSAPCPLALQPPSCPHTLLKLAPLRRIPSLPSCFILKSCLTQKALSIFPSHHPDHDTALRLMGAAAPDSSQAWEGAVCVAMGAQ